MIIIIVIILIIVLIETLFCLTRQQPAAVLRHIDPTVNLGVKNQKMSIYMTNIQLFDYVTHHSSHAQDLATTKHYKKLNTTLFSSMN